MTHFQHDTMIALQTLPNGKIKVVELPAGKTDSFPSRRSFTTKDQAEEYIKDQYSHLDCIRCSLEELEMERDNRKLQGSPFQRRMNGLLTGDIF